MNGGDLSFSSVCGVCCRCLYKTLQATKVACNVLIWGVYFFLGWSML